MTIKKQKEIKFINDCKCIVDLYELSRAIIWYQDKPTASVKHIYMLGKYPSVSIHKTKIHIHRLLMLYWNNGYINKNVYVHHIDGNKLNASKDNLILTGISEHQSFHNIGKTISEKQIKSIIAFNHSRKGKRRNNKRNDISPRMVFDMKKQGFSFNYISIKLGLDWLCVKQRYNDYIHDNPELIKP